MIAAGAVVARSLCTNDPAAAPASPIRMWPAGIEKRAGRSGQQLVEAAAAVSHDVSVGCDLTIGYNISAETFKRRGRAR
jgi:hypothetical protein